MKKSFVLILSVVLLGGAVDLFAQGFSARHAEIISQMQAMAKGGFTEADWNGLMDRLDVLLADTEAAGDLDGYVEAQVIRAKCLSARGRHGEAMNLMQNVLATHRNAKAPAMKKVYVEIAALHARSGNEAGVKQIMDEFKKSPHFDKHTYSFEGGSGPGDPLKIPRPSVGLGDSVSVTAMEVQRTRSRHAPGTMFPEFNAVDWSGQPVSLKDLRGKVVLVDLWVDTLVWRRDVAFRKGIYERHSQRGFEILGMHIGPDEAAARELVRANGLTWSQANAPRTLKSTLGVFGNVSNFLLDQNGMVVGRDLYAADLEEAVRRTLGR